MTSPRTSLALPAAPVLLTALALAVVPTLVLLVGLPLHSSAPGTCDAWPDCSPSAREQWAWTTQGWSNLGIWLGAFVAASAVVWPWWPDHPVAARRTAIGALCLLVPLTAADLLLAAALWGTDCTDAAWICFGGRDDALVAATPALVTVPASVLLLWGLAARGRGAGDAAGRVALTGLAAAVAATVALVVAGGVVGAAVTALGG